jgi:predicted ATPase
MIEKLIIIAGIDTKIIENFAHDLECKLNIFVKRFPENSLHPSKLKKDVKFWIDNFNKLIICTHSDFLFTHLRALICQNKIHFRNVEIYWISGSGDSIKIEIDKDGRIENWPKGFFDSIDEELEILIQGSEK